MTERAGQSAASCSATLRRASKLVTGELVPAGGEGNRHPPVLVQLLMVNNETSRRSITEKDKSWMHLTDIS
jgi:hypothetical protein